MRRILVKEPVYRSRMGKNVVSELWLAAGSYTAREFDETRLLVRTGNKCTLVKKKLTSW